MKIPTILLLVIATSVAQQPDINSFARDAQAVVDSIQDLDRRVIELEVSPGPSPSNPYEVFTWPELVRKVNSGQPIYLNRILGAQNGTLESTKALTFGPLGALQFSGQRLVLNLPIINPDNHPVFLGVDSDESYPERWESQSTSVIGSFGGQWIRDPRWWGLTSSLRPSWASYREAETNNQAIAAAALSRPHSGAPITIQLPPGKIPVRRTVRLDGLRSTLRGAGTISIGSTHLWTNSEVWLFSQAHTIQTEHFQAGTIPVIEIGYERQPDSPNPDEGFQNGVENLTVVCPLNTPVPVSGIMWESGLQEVSTIRYVSVSNYSGYGIGGPTKQHMEHNDPTPKSYLPQVNTVVFEKLWIHSPSRQYPNAIGMSVHGLNFEIRNLTIHHHNGPALFRQPGLIVSSREAARVSQIHIEHNPPRGVDSAAPAILVPDDRTASGLHIDGAYLYLAANLYPDTKSEVVRIANPSASITLTNINHRTGTIGPLNETTQCVNDIPRGKQSGAQFREGSGKTLATYARQRILDGQYQVVTTDPNLK